ncbi:hypothetical protein P7K49_030277, partial [Saguinus oedipus]
MEGVTSTRMVITGNETVSVLGPASDLKINMPKIQAYEILSRGTRTAEMGFEKPGSKAH